MVETNREYWRKNLTIAGIVLLAWVILTVMTGYSRTSHRPVTRFLRLPNYAMRYKNCSRITWCPTSL